MGVLRVLMISGKSGNEMQNVSGKHLYEPLKRCRKGVESY
jgi:hypothetical protein